MNGVNCLLTISTDLNVAYKHPDATAYVEEELSDQGTVCDLATGLGLFLLKSLFTQNLPAG